MSPATSDLASRVSQVAASSAPGVSGGDLASRVSQIAQSDPNQSFYGNPSDTGERTNDVGNTLIVPKEGEEFGDTMARAAAQGKKTTPEMINKEVATMPEKVTRTLVAAPLLGAGGTAALAGAGEAGAALGDSEVGQAVVKGGKAIAQLAAKYPKTAAVLQYLGLKYSGLFHQIPELPLLIALTGHGAGAAEEGAAEEGAAAAEGAAGESAAGESAPKPAEPTEPELPKVPAKTLRQSKALGPEAKTAAQAEALKSAPTPKTEPEPAPRRRIRALSSEPDTRVLEDPAVQKEIEPKPKETPEEFVDRLTNGAYKVHADGKIVNVEPVDAPMSESAKADMAEQSKGKYEPQVGKRGPYKGKAKTVRVFSDGAWHEVQNYVKRGEPE